MEFLNGGYFLGHTPEHGNRRRNGEFADIGPHGRDAEVLAEMDMALVVCGLLNKQIGGQLGISEITVKAHRGRAPIRFEAAVVDKRIDKRS